MRAPFGKALGIATLGFCAATSALSQTGSWGFQCIDPMNMMPRSMDHAFMGVGNLLMRSHMGISGTVTYGGPNGPCYGPTAANLNLAGRIGFMVGTTGSVQDQNPADPSNSAFADDSLVLTTGMPFDPSGSYSYATTTKNGTRTLFGSSGFNLAFVGLSNRYYYAETVLDNVRVQLRVEVAGDATRLQWTLTNLDAEVANLGLWYGAVTGMLTADDSITDLTGANQSGHRLGTLTRFSKNGYLHLPSGRPPRTEARLIRNQDPASSPQFADYLFGQTASFGLRVDNGQTAATTNEFGQSDATETSEFVYGNHTFLLGFLGDQTFPDSPIGDVAFLDEMSFIQKFPELAVAAGQSRTIVHYLRAPWSVANYTAPYAAVVDAPQLVAADTTNQNGVRPNPMTIRVYVDNWGFGVVNQEIPLNDVKITLTLPTGLTLSPGEQATKTIPVIAPRTMGFVDYSVESDGIEFGNLAYSVKVEPIPGPTKTMSGIIRIASTPRIKIHDDANLVTAPWIFQDSSWEAILGLQQPVDFQAYKWDPQQQGYVVASSAERGRGAWIVTTNEYGSIPLGGNPQTPPDTATGAPLIQLKSGWNLIGNPYNYPIPLGQIVGVSASNPTQSFRWTELVAQGIVSGSLVFYDTEIDDYVFIQDVDELLQPNRGYWIFVGTVQDFTLSFPAVFIPGLPGSSRGGERWVQTDKQWRLQLAARTATSLDAQNFVGAAKSQAEARRLRVVEPPMSPVQNVSLAIRETSASQPTRLAQTLSERSGRKEWRLLVTTTEAGTVTVTWPNLATVPKNVKFRMTDLATNESRDLRQTSGFSFEMSEAGTREIKLEASPGTPSRALIGNVVVSRPGRSISTPFSIHYTLSSEATTTVRILSAGGREVYTASRGRADRAGENTVTWALRDNANRLVAPGPYRVEIIADTATGERARKIIPVNVIR